MIQFSSVDQSESVAQWSRQVIVSWVTRIQFQLGVENPTQPLSYLWN